MSLTILFRAKRSILGAICICLCVSVAGQSRRVEEYELPADDPRLISSGLVSVTRLADGSAFVISRSALFERHAMIGRYFVAGKGSVEIHASDCVPSEVVQPGTAGQIYAATLLDDGRLALSIGWTTAKSRNINALAILKRVDGGWVRDRTIVMRGSVRHISAGPGNSIVAVITELGRAKESSVLAIVLVEPSGRVRSRLHERTLSVKDAETQALEIRVQRMRDGSIAMFDVPGGTMRLVAVEPLTDCDASVIAYKEDGVYYPTFEHRACDTVSVRRLLSLRDIPEEANTLRYLTVDAVHLHENGSLTIARHGFDGSVTRLVVTTYGHATPTTTSLSRVAPKSVVIGENVVEAVTMSRDTRNGIRVTLGDH